MAKGQSKLLSVDWKPWNALPGTLEWSSQDEKVATVAANGMVEAVGVGTTNVVAEVTLGSEKKTYEVKVTVLASAERFYGFSIVDYAGNTGNSSWITYPGDNLEDVVVIGSDGLVQGGTYYEGNVYFVIAKNDGIVSTMFYKSPLTKGATPEATRIGEAELIATIEGVEVGNLAFDYSTGRMYGVDYTNGGLCLLDIETGGIDLLGTFNGDLTPTYMTAMCVTKNGKIVGADMSGNLYTVDPDTMKATKIGAIEESTWYYAGMAYDHNTGNIYWNPCMGAESSDLYLVVIDEDNLNLSTTEIIQLGAVSSKQGMQQTVLFTIPDPEPETTYIQAESIRITNGEELTGVEQSTIQLTTETTPARPSVSARVWTSSDEEVVSVDKFGELTLKKEGEATITVTINNKGSNPDPVSCSDSIKIKVEKNAGEFVAFLAWDEGATSYYDFWITMKDYDLQRSEVGSSMIGTYSLRTGEYYDGYFYAYSDNGTLYRINAENPGNYVSLKAYPAEGNGTGSSRIISMAFDYTRGIMYGVTLYGSGNGQLVEINLNDGSVTEKYTLDKKISAIAADENGSLYGVGSEAIYQESKLYKIDVETGGCEEIQPIQAGTGVVWVGEDYYSEKMYSPQMTYDYGTKRFYLNATIRHKTYNSFSSGIYMIQMKDDGSGTVDKITNLGKPALNLTGNTKIGNMYLGLLCAIPEEGEVTLEKVTGLRMNREAARVAKDETTQLKVEVSPASAENRAVTWSSADEAIATVDDTGIVTGVSVGTTTITATSNSDNNIVATCQITVIEKKAEGEASIAYTISGDNSELVSFNPELPADTAVVKGTKVGSGSRIVGMAMKDEYNIYYLVESDSSIWPNLYVYNLLSQQSQHKGELNVFIGGASDMAYDRDNGLIYVASGFYIFQFEEKNLQSGSLVSYALYQDTTQLAEMPTSNMHAVACKDGNVYFVGSEIGSTSTPVLYSMTNKFKDLKKVRTVDVNTVSGTCEMEYDSSTGLFYLTDAGDRLYSFTEDESVAVTAIDILGDGRSINGLAIWPGKTAGEAGSTAETTETAKPSASEEMEESTESSDTAETEASTESPEAAETEGSTESPEAAETEGSTESPEAAETEGSTESSNEAETEASTESSDTAETEGTTESPEAAEEEASMESSEAAKTEAATESTDTAEPGEAGKGFAVVAEQVKVLAQQNSDSAKETAVLIEQSLKTVGDGNEIAQATSNALEEIANYILQVSDGVDDISRVAQKEAQGTREISSDLSAVSTIAQANSATSEEIAASSEELAAQAHSLNLSIDQFKID